MSSFEAQIQEATEQKIIPGVVLVASDVEDKFSYKKAFGPARPGEPMTLDATFLMASCTKLLTSMAGLQCVERGQIGLDDDVSDVLIELKGAEILTGFEKESEKPILKRAEKKITILHLLTHTSGLGYDFLDPRYIKWRESRGESMDGMPLTGMPILQRINIPLLFEPGTSWCYGVSTDWVGVLVSRLNGIPLEDYMKKYIFDPLSIKSFTFHQEKNIDTQGNLVKLAVRLGIDNPHYAAPVDNGQKIGYTDIPLYENPTVDECGGAGIMGNAVEYTRILQSILANDGKILKPETVEEMFKPQLGEDARRELARLDEMNSEEAIFASLPVGTKVDWGLGGLVLTSDTTTMRKGTLMWSGLPTLQWSIDRETGLCLMYASNVVPWGDHQSGVYQRLFEKEIYERFAKVSK